MRRSDILRETVIDGSETGKELKAIMNKGLLVPDDMAQTVLEEHVRSALANQNVKGVLLDGYPRTIKQAHLLDETLASVGVNDFQVVDIKLDTGVTVQKLLNRKQCETCGDSFNTAHIVTGSYDMPAILPDPTKCKLKGNCNPVLCVRGDDTEETVKVRLQQHDLHVAPILDYYNQKGILKTFHVHKGVKDVDALIDLIVR
jgi:adenylate kinase